MRVDEPPQGEPPTQGELPKSNIPEVDDNFRQQMLLEQLSLVAAGLRSRWRHISATKRAFWPAIIGWCMLMVTLTVATHSSSWQTSIMATGSFSFAALLMRIASALHQVLAGVLAVQIVFWWQSAYPQRPSAWDRLGIGMLYSAFVTFLSGFWLSESFTGRWVIAWFFLPTLLSLAFTLLAMRIASPFCRFWLMPRDEMTPSSIHSLANGSRTWSIRGIMLTTLAVAAWISLNRLMSSSFLQLDPQAVPLIEPGVSVALLSLSTWKFLLALVTAYLAAALNCGLISGVGRKWIATLVAAVVVSGLSHSGQWIAFSWVNASTGWTIPYGSFGWGTLEWVFVFSLHLLWFHLWLTSGYTLVGWMRGFGFIHPSRG